MKYKDKGINCLETSPDWYFKICEVPVWTGRFLGQNQRYNIVKLSITSLCCNQIKNKFFSL